MEAILDCTSGWWSRQEWTGTRLDKLVGTGGRSIVVRSATGYARPLPATDAAHLLLATRLGVTPTSPAHGAPCASSLPGGVGFWWVKWVDRVEVRHAVVVAVPFPSRDVGGSALGTTGPRLASLSASGREDEARRRRPPETAPPSRRRVTELHADLRGGDEERQ